MCRDERSESWSATVDLRTRRSGFEREERCPRRPRQAADVALREIRQATKHHIRIRMRRSRSNVLAHLNERIRAVSEWSPPPLTRHYMERFGRRGGI